MTPERGVIPCKTKQEKKTMSKSSVLEGCSESCIVPPSPRAEEPRTEQPWQEQGGEVKPRDRESIWGRNVTAEMSLPWPRHCSKHSERIKGGTCQAAAESVPDGSESSFLQQDL